MWLVLGCLGADAADSTVVKAQYDAITKEYDHNTRRRETAVRAKPDEVVAKIVALAEQHPKDPATEEALLWLQERFSRMKGMEKAGALLASHFPVSKEYADLVAAHHEAQQNYFTETRQAKNGDEQIAAWEKFQGTGKAFVELARKHPRHPAALRSLVFVTQRFHQLVNNELVDMLGRDFIDRPQLAAVCPVLAYSVSSRAEVFLRAVLARSPHREVKGQAALTLGQLLLHEVNLTALSSADAKHLESIYGREAVAQVRARDAAHARAEGEKFLELAAGEYADVEFWSGTVGGRAKAELFELRELAVGKVAPEIEGEDVDGVKFKLSDYRGKVVVIDFWGDW
ncbi:MAG: hypothetical protein AB1705_14090 [Verrucomicrobiota bacterium]